MNAATQERECAAIHEAAHVVIAEANSLILSTVRVSLDGTGHFHFDWPIPPAEMTPADRRRIARGVAKCAIAGLLAESIPEDSLDRFLHRLEAFSSGIDGEYVARIRRSGSDVDDLHAYALEAGTPDEELVRECAADLNARWPRVEELAGAILAKWIPGEFEVRLDIDEIAAALKKGTR